MRGTEERKTAVAVLSNIKCAGVLQRKHVPVRGILDLSCKVKGLCACRAPILTGRGV